MRSPVHPSAPAAGDALITAAEFGAAMAPLGPFEPAPRLAVGVSGGPDSMALAVLADAWARERGGSVLALIVDHGLRATSRAEAQEAAGRLGARGISSRALTVEGLERGPALAARAREARFRALTSACEEAGVLHLLLGHHAADQAETVLIRTLGGSGAPGLAAMGSVVELPRLRLLRPLLGIPPVRLRALLVGLGVGWAEDPSNVDPAALRPRLRLLRRDRDGAGSATGALVAAAVAAGRQRAGSDRTTAAELAQQVALRPEGFALHSGQPVARCTLAALLQAISGARYPPAGAGVALLAASPRPATLAGARLLSAGRLGPGLLVVRESAAMSPPVPAFAGTAWDGRFRIAADAQLPPGATLGALGNDAAGLRRLSSLPSVVLQTLPAFRDGARLLAVPHLCYPDGDTCAQFPIMFSPPVPTAAAPFAFRDASNVESPYLDVS